MNRAKPVVPGPDGTLSDRDRRRLMRQVRTRVDPDTGAIYQEPPPGWTFRYEEENNRLVHVLVFADPRARS